MKQVVGVLGRYGGMPLLLLGLWFGSVQSTDVGSESLVSVENFTSIAPSGGVIATFAFMRGGFGLNDATTTCTFRSIFPVSGLLSLHGGELNLQSDLVMTRSAAFVSGGTIRGLNDSLELCSSITGLPVDVPSIFTNTNLFLNGDFTIATTAKFRGSCVVDGRGNVVSLTSAGHILVDNNATLRLKNMELNGLCGGSLICLSDSSKLILDNVRWVQTGDYSFTNGSILFQNATEFVGAYNFYYQSGLTSTIDIDSEWKLSEIISLNIGRKAGIGGREPLYFFDRSSILHLEDCSLNATSSGMRLTRGTILVGGEAQFHSSTQTTTLGGLWFGRGNLTDDVNFQVRPAGVVLFQNGRFIDDIVDQGSFLGGDTVKKFARRGVNTYLYPNQNLRLNQVEVSVDLLGPTNFGAGKSVYYIGAYVTTPVVDFYATVTQGGNFYTMAGNGNILLTQGTFPIPLMVRSTGNVIGGHGSIAAPISLANGGASLAVGIDGSLMANVALNGGTMILGGDLKCATDILPSGSGTINLGANSLKVYIPDIAWTASQRFVGSGGTVKLAGDTTIAAPLVFDGQCSIDAGGNAVNLATAASFVVRPGATLTLKNMTLAGVDGSQIRCLTDSGKIVFDNVGVVLDGSWTFSRGSVKIQNNVDFSGTATFFYQSTLTSTINTHSKWSFGDQSWLSIGRGVAYREPLYFNDATSILEFNGGNMSVTSSGMRLTRGTVNLNRQIVMDIVGTNTMTGLVLGDGTSADNIHAYWGPGAVVSFPRGSLTYEVTSPNALQSRGGGARLVPGGALQIALHENLTLAGITVQLGGAYSITSSPGKTLNYNSTTFFLPGVLYDMTASRYDASTNILNNGGSVVARTGTMPVTTLVARAGNTIQGAGSIGGSVLLTGTDARLALGIDGGMNSDVTVSGGEVTLTRPVTFGDNKSFITQGTIHIGSNSVSLGGTDLLSTSTLLWDGSGGVIQLRSNLTLQSCWSFSGNCIIKGDGNTIEFGSAAGAFAIERGSTLTLKNVAIKGLGPTPIYCVDNAGTLIFDSVDYQLNNNFTFSLGHFEVANFLNLYGDGVLFYYQSDQPSKLRSRSTMMLDGGIVFFYQPPVADGNLLQMTDQSSKLRLIGATVASTSTGLKLTKGSLSIEKHCYFVSNGSTQGEGIIFGDATSSANDLTVEILPDARLDLTNGYLVYGNIA